MQRKPFTQVQDHQSESGRLATAENLSITMSCLSAHLLGALNKRRERSVLWKGGANFGEQPEAKHIGIPSLVGSTQERSCSLLNGIPSGVMFGQLKEPDDGAKPSQRNPQLVNGLRVLAQQERLDIGKQMDQGFAQGGRRRLTNRL
jgi:hypothetical protein